MGKSLGNAYMLADVEQRGFSVLDLRYFYTMALYSSSQNFTREALESAKSSRTNLKKKIQKAVSELHMDSATLSEYDSVQSLPELSEKLPATQALIDMIDEAIKDNLNTPKLLSVISNATNQLSAESLAVLYWLEKKYLKV